MSAPVTWLVAAALLTVLQWLPYIANRALLWSPREFIVGYTDDPARPPDPPPWADRSKRAHANMVETLPSFAVVVLAGEVAGVEPAGAGIAAGVFVVARVVYAAVYTLGVPYLRTPVYLLSWGAILYLGGGLLLG